MDTRVTHLKAIHYFAVASKTLSYTKAAQELFVSQAAVSQQIRLLEDHLGNKLFYRAGRDMQLTTQGHILADHLGEAFDLIAKGMDRVKAEPFAGNLSIICPQSFASSWMMPKLWRFTAMHDEITARLLCCDFREDLRAGNADIDITNEANSQKDCKQITLLETEMILVASKSLAQSINFTCVDDLLRCWLIQADEKEYSWPAYFKEFEVKTDEKKKLWAEVSSWYMGISAVKAGHGVFICPKIMIQDDLKSGELVHVLPDFPFNKTLTFYMYYQEFSPRIERIKAFEKWITDELAGISIDPFDHRHHNIEQKPAKH